MRKKSLGRGLDALLGGGERGGEIKNIPLESIEPNPYQPRTSISESELAELAATIKEKGVLQPVIVRPVNGKYQLVSGERRWRAAKLAGLKTVPALIKSFSDREMLEVALIENVQRENLSPIDEALAYERLMKEFGYTQEEVAKKVGKSRSAVANTIRLLKLPEPIKKALREGKITEGHARAILSLKTRDAMMRAFKNIIREKKSVREAERIRGRQRDPNVEALEKKIYRATGIKVNLTFRGGKGKLIFHYSSLSELEHLLRLLGIPEELQ